jgi:hypothetical protein
MHNGQYIFYQLSRSLSQYTFQRCVQEYRGDRYVKSLTCWQQFLCLSFGQLTFRESLRSIVLCLNTHPKKLYHLGFSSPIKLSTLAYANERRDWRIYESFGYYLIGKARKLYQDDTTFLDDLKGTFYALDATTIDLCLSVFKWAHFRERKGAVKLHTLLDLRGNIPVFIRVTDGTVHEVNILDSLPIEVGACYVMDRGYLDYRRLYALHTGRAFFITRAKRNTRFVRIYSHTVRKSTGIRCDQTIRFLNHYAAKEYPKKLRRIKYHDDVTDNTYVFLTNNFDLTAEQIADIYKRRWEIEQFFKWIKGHLKVKVFWGESANAVKTQIWVAICTYVMVAILKKEHRINQSMYEILQILSVNTFERIPLVELFSDQSLCNFIQSSEIQAKLPSF